MAIRRDAEAALLRFASEALKEDGYSVVLDPPPSSLPAELRAIRPDAIALGKKPYLVIEVAREGTESAARVERIQRAIQGDPEWQLHLVFNRGDVSEALAAARISDIRKAIGGIRETARSDTRAALVVCWACLEALSRVIAPKDFGRPQTPSRIVERLAAAGYVVPSDAKFLRQMALKRNAFVHGELAADVAAGDIKRFIGVLEGLEKTVQQGAA